MTQTTKQFLAIIILIAVGSVSGMAWAQDRPGIPDRAVAFCERVKANRGDESQLLSELETVTANAQAQTLQRLQDRRAEQLSQIEELRNSTKFEFKSNVKLLSSRARTPEQKSAVENFSRFVEQSLANRQAIVDNAQESFRNNFNRIVRERQNRMMTAVSDFRSSYLTIFQTAVRECSIPGNAKTARDNFLNSAQGIRQNLVVQLSPSQSINETKPLAIARNLVVKEANDRFTADIKSAERELRAALR